MLELWRVFGNLISDVVDDIIEQKDAVLAFSDLHNKPRSHLHYLRMMRIRLRLFGYQRHRLVSSHNFFFVQEVPQWTKRFRKSLAATLDASEQRRATPYSCSCSSVCSKTCLLGHHPMSGCLSPNFKTRVI